MRRFGLAAVTCLQGVVACGTVFGFEDPVFDQAVNSDAGPDAGPVVETPAVPGDPTHTCVPAAPPDWLGPLIVYEGTGNPLPDPPACPSSYGNGVDYYTQLNAPNATCACDCEKAAGGSCEATITWFKDGACKTPCDGQPPPTIVSSAASCVAAPGCADLKITSKFNPGTCAVKQGAVKKPETSWGTRSRVCTAAPSTPGANGCAAGRVAIPTTSLPFATNTYCIAKTGADECPTDIYPRKRLYFSSVNDTRDCACTCEKPTGGNCNGGFAGSEDANGMCAAAKTVAYRDTEDCQAATKKGWAAFTGTGSEGTCAPKANPVGNASPATPTTICCTR